MKALFFPFEFVLPVLENDLTVKPRAAYFEYSVYLRDLFNQAIAQGYYLVIYHPEPIKEHRRDIYKQKLLAYYSISELYLFFIDSFTLGSLSSFLSKNIVSNNQSYFVGEDQFVRTYHIKNYGLNILPLQPWFSIDHFKITSITQTINPDFQPENLDTELLHMVLMTFDEISTDRSEQSIFLYQLQIILSAAKFRNNLLNSIMDYINALLEPELSKLICRTYAKRLEFVDFEIVIELEPREMALYSYILDNASGIRYSELIRHKSRLIEKYQLIANKTLEKAETTINNMISGSAIELKSKINNQKIPDELGKVIAQQYSIQVDDNGRWHVPISRTYPHLVQVV